MFQLVYQLFIYGKYNSKLRVKELISDNEKIVEVIKWTLFAFSLLYFGFSFVFSLIRVISPERFNPRNWLFLIYELSFVLVLLILIISFVGLYVFIYLKRKKLLQTFPIRTVICCIFMIDALLLYFFYMAMEFLSDIGKFLIIFKIHIIFGYVYLIKYFHLLQ
jgi:hypothetical protein